MAVCNVLTPEDRRRLESFCARLPELVPDQLAALCHGDLWHGNIAVTNFGAPAYLDPAVHYGWPEADLGMTTQYERFDDRFYDAYDQTGTLKPGWRDRLETCHIKEILSLVAHFGGEYDSLIGLLAFLDKYAELTEAHSGRGLEFLPPLPRLCEEGGKVRRLWRRGWG